MNQTELCEKIKYALYSINVFQDGELVSAGSGAAINERGDLITAAHVISGNLPPKDADLRGLDILARSEGNIFEPYSIACCAVWVTIEGLNPIVVDLALLKNRTPANDRKFLPISSVQPELGVNILMAGYPDEIELPFSVSDKLDFSAPHLAGRKREFLDAVKVNLRLPMIKSGMIGRISGFDLNDKILEGFMMYIDNGMHYGASGGPVINRCGELIGIITERATTSVSTRQNPGLKVPSGSTLAISPNTILDFYRYQNKENFYCHMVSQSS